MMIPMRGTGCVVGKKVSLKLTSLYLKYVWFGLYKCMILSVAKVE